MPLFHDGVNLMAAPTCNTIRGDNTLHNEWLIEYIVLNVGGCAADSICIEERHIIYTFEFESSKEFDRLICYPLVNTSTVIDTIE